MRHISVSIVLWIEDNIATDPSALREYLEESLFGDGRLIGSVLATADITEKVQENMDKTFGRSSP